MYLGKKANTRSADKKPADRGVSMQWPWPGDHSFVRCVLTSRRFDGKCHSPYQWLLLHYSAQYLPGSVSNPYIRHSTHKLALRWTLLPVFSDGADDYFFGVLDEPRVTRQVHPVRYMSSHNTNADLQVDWFLRLRLRLIMIPIARLRGLKGVCSGSNSWFVASPGDRVAKYSLSYGEIFRFSVSDTLVPEII